MNNRIICVTKTNFVTRYQSVLFPSSSWEQKNERYKDKLRNEIIDLIKII